MKRSKSYELYYGESIAEMILMGEQMAEDGEVGGATALAEAYCHANMHDGWLLDSEHWIWDAAVIAADRLGW